MMNDSPADDRDGAAGRNDGFTLIEILIAIVLVGILSAVAVVGISNLVSKGSKASCGASKDAATAASAVFFASATPNAYPTTFTQMTTVNGPLSLPSSVSVNTGGVSPVGALPAGAPVGTQASSGTSWYLTMTGGGGATAPIFDCKP